MTELATKIYLKITSKYVSVAVMMIATEVVSVAIRLNNILRLATRIIFSKKLRKFVIYNKS